MALSAATVTAITNRWGTLTVAQLTQRENFDQSNPTVDEDVLETMVNHAIEWVNGRLGNVDESSSAVRDAVMIFMCSPDQQSQYIAQWDSLYSKLIRPGVVSKSNSVAKTSPLSTRGYDGQDFACDTGEAGVLIRRGTRK